MLFDFFEKIIINDLIWRENSFKIMGFIVGLQKYLGEGFLASDWVGWNLGHSGVIFYPRDYHMIVSQLCPKGKKKKKLSIVI